MGWVKGSDREDVATGMAGSGSVVDAGIRVIIGVTLLHLLQEVLQITPS
jgi:hypothetical protein